MTLTEKDPCLACDSLSYCVNIFGMPRCQCKPGYVMGSGRCVGRFHVLFDINEAETKKLRINHLIEASLTVLFNV